jgi:hypothetical protein
VTLLHNICPTGKYINFTIIYIINYEIQLSGIQDMIKWTNVRRKEWDAHVERMEDNRLAKIATDNNRPQGVRSRGRPKKRWKESLNAAPSP